MISPAGQTLAELGRHRGVAGQERQQPDRHDRPRFGRLKPRWTARRPGQQQVALVRALLLLGQADRGQRPHARVHAVHQPPVGQCRHSLGALPPYHREQVRRDPDAVPGGHRADQPEIRGSGLGDLQHGPHAR